MSNQLTFNQFYEKLVHYFQIEIYVNRISLSLLAWSILMGILNFFQPNKIPYGQFIWIFITIFAISSLVSTFHGYLYLWILTNDIDNLKVHIEKKELKLYHQISLLERRHKIFLEKQIVDDANISQLNKQLKIYKKRLTMLHQVFPNV